MKAEEFADRLRQLREDRGIGSRELAERIDRSPAFISLIESRQRYKTKLPPTDALLKIAREFGITLEEMIGTLPPPRVAERRAPYLSDAALLTHLGAEPVYDDAPMIDEFTASARNGLGNLIPQNYDDMRPRYKLRLISDAEVQAEVHALDARAAALPGGGVRLQQFFHEWPALQQAFPLLPSDAQNAILRVIVDHILIEGPVTTVVWVPEFAAVVTHQA